MNRCRSTSSLVFLLVASPLCLLSSRTALSQESARSQFWPELDVFYRLDSQWRLFALTSITREREIQYTDWQIGAHLEFSFYPLPPLMKVMATDFERFRAFQFRVGYTYARAVGGNSGDYQEHRGIVEASVRIPVTELLLLSDKNRVDLRGVNGSFSSRYRNRIRVERQTETDFVTLNPFLSAEFFYDSRYETWSRQLYSAGIEWTLSGGTLLETSYQRQTDSQPSTSAVNALGLTVSVFY